MDKIVLKTGITARLPLAADAGFIQDSLNSEAIHRFLMKSPVPFTAQRAKEFIAKAQGFDESFKLLLESNKTALGCVGFKKIENAYRLSFWISPQYQNQGILSANLPLLLQEISNKTGIKHFEAWAFENNMGSRRALQNCGFTTENKFKKVQKGNCETACIQYSLQL